MMDALGDSLSESVRAILDLGSGKAYGRLVVANGESGEHRNDLRRQLRSLTPERLLTRPLVSLDDARAMLAGLWLWHDFLDESHTISQGLHSQTGSFWHAIMHRREGDFSNSKYWYARCRGHPAMRENPDALVDLVARVYDDPADPLHDRAIHLQRLEWQGLFAHCVKAAAGIA